MKRSYSCRCRQLLPRSVALAVLGISAWITAMPAQAGSTLVVDDDGHATAINCDAGGRALRSVQEAVDAAQPGDTIQICPGTYDEQVVVRTNGLTIQGAGAGLTVLRPGVVSQNTLRPGTTSPVAPILLVDGATGVNVTALTIDGSLGDGGASLLPTCSGTPFYAGIFYRNSTGRIDRAHVANTMSATFCAMGILGYSGAGGAVDLAVTNSLVDNYGVGGIICVGRNTACTLTGNAVRGRGPVVDQLQSGISIRNGAEAAIAGNAITDHFFAPGRGALESSTGLFLFYADPDTVAHLVRDNVFAGNQLNIQIVASEAAF